LRSEGIFKFGLNNPDKMKKTFACAVLCCIFFACKKNGTGGDATVVAFPEHHGKPIKGCTAYVKFNSSDLPADYKTKSDMVVAGEEKEDHIHIKGLLPGNYFIVAEGYDSSIMAPVKGGLNVKISRKQKKDELDVKIPVTE
jgi:hypothetical protein